MTTLAADAVRTYGLGDMSEYPVIAADIIYEGAAVGQVKASGHVRPLTSVDRFVGFAERQADNALGAAAAIRCRVKRRGIAKLSITGAVITDPVGSAIYATDDNAFSFSPVGGVFVGKLARWESAGVVLCEFDVDKMTDPHDGFLAELRSANFTTDVQDTGKVICIDTDAVVVTLVATAGGGTTRFMNLGSYGTVGFSLSPQAADKIQGPDIGGTDNKDLINTKATAQRGDYVELVWGQADGPTVRVIKGVWATEA